MPSQAKSRLAGLAIAAAFALPASAAWAGEASGFYIGGLAGIGEATSSRTETNLPTFARPAFAQPASSPGAYVSPTVSLLLGKEWRLSDRVSFGLEAEGDYDGAHASWRGEAISGLYSAFNALNDDVTAASTGSLAWSAALRARVAFAVSPTFSVYGSIGPAIGRARLDASVGEHDYGSSFNRALLRSVPFDNFYGAALGRTVWTPGLSVDAGVETALANDVSFRVGYNLTAFRPITLAVPLPNNASVVGDLKATPLLQAVRLGFVKRF